MKKIRIEMIKLFVLSGIVFIILLAVLYRAVTEFMVQQEIQKARLLTHTLIYTREYLAKMAPYIKVTDKKFHPFSMTPAYAVGQIAIMLRKNDGIYVKQTSDNYRNVDNKPNKHELEAIEYLKNHKSAKEFFKVHRHHGNLKKEHIFYVYPLKIKKSCLKCHGDKDKISKPLLKKLESIYGDKAFGYKLGDLRGVISIRIPFNEVKENINTLFLKISILLLALYLGGIYFFMRLNNMILKDIAVIDNYLENTLSKNIYRPLKEKLIFFELNLIKKGLNNAIKALKNYKKESFENLYYNHITKLPNRRKLIETMKRINAPVVIFDIDSFKDINYYYGEQIANNVVKEVANRLKKYKPFHIKIDQFAILLNKDLSKEEAYKLVKQLIYDLEQPYYIDEHSIIVKFRAGISYTKKDFLAALSALDATRIINKDIAFCSEAQLIRNKYKDHLVWIKKLKEALEDDRIVPFFQPILNRDKNICKYEALVRLIDEDGKVISPFFFLDIAKKSRLYLELTKRMVNKVFEIVKTKDVEISINLSTLDMNNEYMRNFILNKLKELKYPQRIHFEIVESEEIKESDNVVAFIKELKNYKCKILIDDFGSGYANFDYLLSLGADAIKIDGTLIKNILTDKNSQIVVKTIISFAKQVNMQVIAEFVEDYEVFEYLKTEGVDCFQGYFYSAPKPELE